jgi:hypothetical protein
MRLFQHSSHFSLFNSSFLSRMAETDAKRSKANEGSIPTADVAVCLQSASQLADDLKVELIQASSNLIRSFKLMITELAYLRHLALALSFP